MPNPFVHVELSSSDVKKAEKFYKSIFGWKLQSRPEFDYTMIDVGAGTGGGMTKQQQPGAPSAWLPYVEVDDVKQTVAKAAKAGANVMVDYLEIGQDMGSIGVFADPTGAVIGVWAKGAGAAPAEPAAKPAKAAKAKAEQPSKAPAKVEKAAAKPAKVEKAAAKPAKVEKAAAKPAKVEKAAAKPAKAEKPGKAEKAAAKPAKAPAKAEKPAKAGKAEPPPASKKPKK